MIYSPQLKTGVFLKRYKRFFADIKIGKEIGVAHVANTGSLKTVNVPNRPCLFSTSADPNRKLKYSLEAIQMDNGTWVGVNTSVPNKVIKEALESKLLPHWKSFSEVRGEYAITKETRFDFAAKTKDSSDYDYFIEVKNVTYAEGDVAKFPDSVTERGQKHLRELIRLKSEGYQCEIVFVIQRSDCTQFAAAEDLDPEYAKLLEQAKKKGVIITPLVFEVSAKGLQFVRPCIPTS